jgi:hypothetical protein
MQVLRLNPGTALRLRSFMHKTLEIILLTAFLLVAIACAGPKSRDGNRPTTVVCDMAYSLDPGLQWLADHQNVDGHWSADKFMDDSTRTARGAKSTGSVEFTEEIAAMRGGKATDVGRPWMDLTLTALSLLAFLGDGRTYKDPTYGKVVRKAARYILLSQASDGQFWAKGEGARDWEIIPVHAVCLMAMAELFEISYLTDLKMPVVKAARYAANELKASVAFGKAAPSVESNSIRIAWLVRALHSAKLSEWWRADEQAATDQFFADAWEHANLWFDHATTALPGLGERTGYNWQGNPRPPDAGSYEPNPLLDACNLVTRLHTGEWWDTDKTESKRSALAAVLLNHKPAWGATVVVGDATGTKPTNIDFLYWYWASLALFRIGGEACEQWERALVAPTLLAHQRGWIAQDIDAFGPGVKKPSLASAGQETADAGRFLLDEHGSWDPVDAWSSVGGRVYATAINTLTCEIYWRYAHLRAAQKAKEDPAPQPVGDPAR